MELMYLKGWLSLDGPWSAGSWELTLCATGHLEANKPNLPEVLNCTSLAVHPLLPVEIHPLCGRNVCLPSEFQLHVALTGQRFAGSFAQLGNQAGTGV